MQFKTSLNAPLGILPQSELYILNVLLIHRFVTNASKHFNTAKILYFFDVAITVFLLVIKIEKRIFRQLCLLYLNDSTQNYKHAALGFFNRKRW